MPKHTFTITVNVLCHETEFGAVAVYDVSREYLGILFGEPQHKIYVEIYEVYIPIGLNRPNIYLDGLLSDSQYMAIEEEIRMAEGDTTYR